MSAVQVPPPIDPLAEPGGEPAWEVAYLFPPQGEWGDGDYLGLTTNRLVELNDGRLEVLPEPTEYHQTILIAFFDVMRGFVERRRLGVVYFAPLRVRIRPGKYREPDILFMKAENAHRRSNRFSDGADLVVEVVSEDDPQRDWEAKLIDYAEAGIPEYWIADPRDRTLTVFSLDPGQREYRRAGRYAAGDAALSILLDGLTVDVATIFETR